MNRTLAEAYSVLNDCRLLATATYACAERDIDFGEELFDNIFLRLLDEDVSNMLPLAKCIRTKFEEQGGIIELPTGKLYDMPLVDFIEMLTVLTHYVNLYASEQEEVLLRTFIFNAILDVKLHWDIRTISVRINDEVQKALAGLEDRYTAGYYRLLEEFTEISEEYGLDLSTDETDDEGNKPEE